MAEDPFVPAGDIAGAASGAEPRAGPVPACGGTEK